MFGSMLQTLSAILMTVPLLLGSIVSASSVPDVLYAAHYSPGLMEKVAERRNMQRVDCMISSPWHPLNTWIRLESQKNGEVAYCRTTDVSAPWDKARHMRLHIIELDWVTAQRLCDVHRVATQSPRSCPVRIEVVSEKIALAALAPPATAIPTTPPEPTPLAVTITADQAPPVLTPVPESPPIEPTPAPPEQVLQTTPVALPPTP